jgi:hypothetical protein
VDASNQPPDSQFSEQSAAAPADADAGDGFPSGFDFINGESIPESEARPPPPPPRIPEQRSKPPQHEPIKPPAKAARTESPSGGSTAGDIMRQGMQGGPRSPKKQGLFGKPKGVAAFKKKPEPPPQAGGLSAIDQMLSFVHAPYRPVSAPVSQADSVLFGRPSGRREPGNFDDE